MSDADPTTPSRRRAVLKLVLVTLASTALALTIATKPLTAPLPNTLRMADMTWVEVRSAVAQGYTRVVVPTGGGGLLAAVLNRVEMYNNSAHGLGVAGNGTVYIKDVVTESVSANNGMAGFVVSAPGGGLPSKLSIVRSVAFSNGTRGRSMLVG